MICPEGKEVETITRLARVGYDNTLGYLKNGFQSWINAGFEIDSIEGITAVELAEKLKNNDLPVFDVRKPGEYENENLEISKSSK